MDKLIEQNDELYNQIKTTPITILILLVNISIWLYHFAYDFDITKVSFNYNDIINKREYWRIIISNFTHLNFIHILFNSVSIWSSRSIEIVKGSYYYFICSILLISLTNLLFFIELYIFKKFKKQLYNENNHYIGYSCIGFGLMVINLRLLSFNGNEIINYSPFLSLLYSSIIIKSSSVIGHLNGIGIGILLNIIDLYIYPLINLNQRLFYLFSMILLILPYFNIKSKFNNNNSINYSNTKHNKINLLYP